MDSSVGRYRISRARARRPVWSNPPKVGFHTFLYRMKVPGIAGPECMCGQGDMTVHHVLLDCVLWQDERRELMGISGAKTLGHLLNSRSGAFAAARFIHRTKLLAQFREV